MDIRRAAYQDSKKNEYGSQSVRSMEQFKDSIFKYYKNSAKPLNRVSFNIEQGRRAM